MVATRPLGVDATAGDAAKCVARGGMDERQVEVAGEQNDGDVHEPVVEQDRVRKPEAGVALAIPEQEARDREQDGESGGDDRVQLLTGVETTRAPAAMQEPAPVVRVEALELADRGGQPGAKANKEQQRDQYRPGERRVQVYILH